jgi:protein involved in polysaccharide export with SLBB domain
VISSKNLRRCGIFSVVIATAAVMLQAGEEKRTSAPSDPISKALSQGVDKIDSGTTSTVPPTLQARDPRYRLRSGDSINLDFQFTPEFNQTLSVQPDGYITLKEIGDVHVAGETVPELRKSL